MNWINTNGSDCNWTPSCANLQSFKTVNQCVLTVKVCPRWPSFMGHNDFIRQVRPCSHRTGDQGVRSSSVQLVIARIFVPSGISSTRSRSYNYFARYSRAIILKSHPNPCDCSYTKMQRVVILALVLIATAAELCEGLRVGAFNIQVFGKTKFGNQEVVKILSQVSRESATQWGLVDQRYKRYTHGIEVLFFCLFLTITI